MATCDVDVLPESLFGSRCGRLVRSGKCPVHGYMIQPSVFEHPEPSPTQTVSTLAALIETLRSA